MADVRVLGAIGVVELHEPVDMAVVQPAFVEAGVWIRPFGRLVYTMPPYVVEPAELDQITRAICEVVGSLSRMSGGPRGADERRPRMPGSVRKRPIRSADDLRETLSS